MTSLVVAGGSLAGCAAAIAARREGAAVELFEPSPFPRHRVCGEFLSPETASLFEFLGVWSEFQACRPAAMRRMILHFPRREKTATFSEPAYGLSRYRLDWLLSSRCAAFGILQRRQRWTGEPSQTCVVATGRRRPAAARGTRLFAFKSHFQGPAGDAVELFFFDGAYVGVSPVEDGATNVCGLAPERLLHAFGFDVDALIESRPPLAGRLRPLRRVMDWLYTGPVQMGHQLHHQPVENRYPAGDLLSFIDPFTGAGMLSALLSGRLAGECAARGESSAVYLSRVRASLQRPLLVSHLFRKLLRSGLADALAPLAPAGVLFRLTRPGAPD